MAMKREKDFIRFLFPFRINNFEGKLSKITSESERERMIETFRRREIDFLNLKRMKMSVEDFQVIKLIGKGAFGIVSRRNRRGR